MHGLHFTHARSTYTWWCGLHITHPCTCCLIPDARTAYHPSMHVLLNTWYTDCILPIHARAAYYLMNGLHVTHPIHTLCDALWPCYTRPWCSSQVLFCIFYIFPSAPDYGDHLTFSLQLLSISNRGHLQILDSNKTIFIVLRHGQLAIGHTVVSLREYLVNVWYRINSWPWSPHSHSACDPPTGYVITCPVILISLNLRTTGCWLSTPFSLGAGKSVSHQQVIYPLLPTGISER